MAWLPMIGGWHYWQGGALAPECRASEPVDLARYTEPVRRCVRCVAIRGLAREMPAPIGGHPFRAELARRALELSRGR